MKKNIELAIIIVSYNHKKYLFRCLGSLIKDKHLHDYRIIVVDNNSSDGTIENLSQKYKSRVVIVRNAVNVGFAKACNFGINSFASNYYLVLNPDIIASKGSVEKMIGFLKKNKTVACVVPLLKNQDGTIQYSCRKFPGWRETLLKRTPLRWFTSLENINKYDLKITSLIEKNIPFRINWALGSCMLIRKSALKKVGLFDERFFLYCEDIDWFYRLKRAKLTAYCLPKSTMRHKHLAVSDNKLFSKESLYHSVGILKFFVKYLKDLVYGRYPP